MKNNGLPAGRQGFVAISVVLILIVVIVSIGSTITLLSIGEAQSGLRLYQGENNLQFVEGCVEDAILKVRANSSYTGGTITRPEGSCTVTVNSGNPNWDITVSSSATDFQRKIQATFVRTVKKIILSNWKEIE